MCFLDASKAFARVRHSVLFNKLTVGVYLDILLSYWYAKQTMRVRWGDCISSPFHVSNGCAKEVYYRPTSLMCIWMTSAVFLIVVILDVCRGILLLTT